jgi:hypothetical protein
MKTIPNNDLFDNRNNPHIQAVNEARATAREKLIDLIATPGNYLHPTFAIRRKAYFDAVKSYADLTDQTFNLALKSIL